MLTSARCIERGALTCLLVALLLMTLPCNTMLSEPMPVQDQGATGTCSREMMWEDEVQLTEDSDSDAPVDLFIDGDGEIHFVWASKSGNISYGKVDQKGALLAGPKVIGWSNRSMDTNPSIHVDSQGRAHITWSNETTSLRSYEYVRMDATGNVQHQSGGAGGDIIVGKGNGFATLMLYNDTSVSALSREYMYLQQFDLQGNPGIGTEVGQNDNGFDHADLIMDGSGNQYIVYMTNSSSMYMTKISGVTQLFAEKPLVTGGTNLSTPRMTFDVEGNIHIVWIDGRPSQEYSRLGVYHMKVAPDGSVLKGPSFVNGTAHYYFAPKDVAITDPSGHRDLGIVVYGHRDDAGSGGAETRLTAMFIEIDKEGNVLESLPKLMESCGLAPRIGQGSDDLFFLIWPGHTCSPGPGPYFPNVLFFMRSTGIDHFVDLAVAEEDVEVPDDIFVGENFTLKITARNVGNLNSTDFDINVTYTDNGTRMWNSTDQLDAGNGTTYSFVMSILEGTNLTVHIDPLGNLDRNLTNNTLEIGLVPRARPDLAVNGSDITFSNIRPAAGETFEISANVHNLGGLGGEADVLFSDGINGTVIGTTHIFTDQEVTVTSVFWNTTMTGVHVMFVNIVNVTPEEPPGAFENNYATKEILVGSHNVPEVTITSPLEGSEVEVGDINITGTARDDDGGPLTVLVKLDDGEWEVAAGSMTGGTLDWFLVWNMSEEAPGPHNVTAMVEDDIHENLTTIGFILVLPPAPPALEIVNYSPEEDPTLYENTTAEFLFEAKANIFCQIQYSWFFEGVKLDDPHGGINFTNLTFRVSFEMAGMYNLTAKAACFEHEVFHTWILTIVDVNRPPKITRTTPGAEANGTVGGQLNLTVRASDPDGDELEYHWKAPGIDKVTTTGNLTVPLDKEGNFTVTVTVSDKRGGNASFTWTISVGPEEGPPIKPGTSQDEFPWWLLIVFLGIFLISLMAIIYWRRYARDRGPPEGGGGGEEGTESTIEEDDEREDVMASRIK